MKQQYAIYSSLLMVILLLLLSCKAGNREASQDYAFKEESTSNISLQETFQSDSLSDVNLRAFENRAIQKLHDVMDLIEILSDSMQENTFRSQAKVMLLENFENADDNQISLILPDIKPFQYSVSRFADTLLHNRFLPLKLKMVDATIKKPLSLQNNNTYQGTIFFILEPTANRQTLYPKELTATIILKKTTKTFGDTVREVWEVFLGDVGN